MNHGITDVTVTKHALDRTDGGEKSKCQIPASILKRYVRSGKGRQFYDEKTDKLHFVVEKTVIVADYDSEQDLWKIVTAYRMEGAVSKRGHRYTEVEPDNFKRSRE